MHCPAYMLEITRFYDDLFYGFQTFVHIYFYDFAFQHQGYNKRKQKNYCGRDKPPEPAYAADSADTHNAENQPHYER